MVVWKSMHASKGIKDCWNWDLLNIIIKFLSIFLEFLANVQSLVRKVKNWDKTCYLKEQNFKAKRVNKIKTILKCVNLQCLKLFCLKLKIEYNWICSLLMTRYDLGKL